MSSDQTKPPEGLTGDLAEMWCDAFEAPANERNLVIPLLKEVARLSRDLKEERSRRIAAEADLALAQGDTVRRAIAELQRGRDAAEARVRELEAEIHKAINGELDALVERDEQRALIRELAEALAGLMEWGDEIRADLRLHTSASGRLVDAARAALAKAEEVLG